MLAKITGLTKLLFVGAISGCLLLAMNVMANQSNAEQALRDYWAAMQRQDRVVAASLVHPKSLRRIRIATDNYVATLMKFDSYGGNLRAQFGVSTRKDYDKLSDAFIFQLILKKLAVEPGFVEILKATKWQTIGSINERDDLVHILYKTETAFFDSQGNRLKSVTFTQPIQPGQLVSLTATITIADPDQDRVEVISVKKENATWLVLTGDEIENRVKDWEKGLNVAIENMQKLAKFLPQKAKSKTKTPPAGR